MTVEELKIRINSSEFRYSASRSGGPGGQNVNKVNTKVELRFRVEKSGSLTDNEKQLVITSLKNRITAEGDILIISQSERTQLQNREHAEEIFYRLVSKALTPKPPRKKTRPTSASRQKRLETKKKRSLIKTLRKDNDFSS
jgi:ribosome-associated protein